MENYEKYSRFYSPKSFWNKVKGFAEKAGAKVIYAALLLYYMFVDELIDLKSKMSIVAGLGYFIFPFDIVPDLLPLIGFSDDLSVLLFTLSVVRGKINDTHRFKAQKALGHLFQHAGPGRILTIDHKAAERRAAAE